mmetsp:Transcript_28775/g.63437  ORF Transcript_28775/g.63437 Transcript_28775/m.63437 type:complete len:201 (+) Transcript_28775:647-1249(+)
MCRLLRGLGWIKHRDTQGVAQHLAEIHGDHLLALHHIRQAKLNRLIHAVQHGTIQIPRAVGGEDEHELGGRCTGVVQHGGEGVPQMLAHGGVTRTQERIGLIDEKQDTPSTPSHPGEELVQLRHSLVLEGGDITSGHDSVLQAGGLCVPHRTHGLPRPRWPIEHQIHQWCLPLLRSAGSQRQSADLLMQGIRQHHVAEML